MLWCALYVLPFWAMFAILFTVVWSAVCCSTILYFERYTVCYRALCHARRPKISYQPTKHFIVQMSSQDTPKTQPEVKLDCWWLIFAFWFIAVLAFYPSRTGPKGLRAESARAFSGRRNSHSGRGEDFLSHQLIFFTETAVTPERKVKKSFPRWEINRHAKG